MTERPPALREHHLAFLDILRESGITNMFGAAPYLREHDPELSHDDAKAILAFWMRTFGERTQDVRTAGGRIDRSRMI